MKSILFSTSQTAHSFIDQLKSRKEYDAYNFIGILDDDDNKQNKMYYGLKVTGKWKDIESMVRSEGVTHFGIGVGALKHMLIKNALFKYCCRLGLLPITSFHSTSYVSPSVTLEQGQHIFPLVSISPDCHIGNNCTFVNGASVLEAVTIEENVMVGGNSFIGGHAYVEENVYIAPGCTIGSRVRIGRNTVVGAGATVLKDLPPDSFAFGTPISAIKQNTHYIQPAEWLLK